MIAASRAKISELAAPKLWLDPVHVAKAKSILTSPTLAVAPTANWVGKQWPSQYYIEILEKFLKTYPEADALLVAAPHESAVVKTIQQSLESPRIKILLSADLPYVAAALGQCDVFLGNDSGPMHMAAALNIPTLGLFGPSDDTRYGPYGPNNKILRIPQKLNELEQTPGFSYQGSTCYMEGLKPDDVWNALSNLWESMHAKVTQLADIAVWSKSQGVS